MIQIHVAKPPRFNRSRADRKNIVILSTIASLNLAFLDDKYLSNVLERADGVFDVVWTNEDAKALVSKLLPLFLEVESDPVFIYAYADTWAQVMLEHLRNPAKRAYWTEILEYTTAILNSMEFNEALYEEADAFYKQVNDAIFLNTRW